jgi:sterol desaturase/sphingolipid hydroxylase (fatty acid hydroxylase superfamily)
VSDALPATLLVDANVALDAVVDVVINLVVDKVRTLLHGESLAHPTDAAGTFVAYCIGFFARYALFCGGAFFVFHRLRWLRRYKIQQDEPSARMVRHEILWSASNTVCTGLFSVLLAWMVATGRTAMYADVDEYGWAWFFLSIPLGTLGFDTWFYWQHRALHTPWLFRHVHSIHHRPTNPTAFAGFAHHPGETFAEDLYFLLFVVVVPVHPLAMGLVGLHAFTLAILGHMGFEFFPRGFTRYPLLGLHNTATHHNMHHSHVGGNYSLYFNVWDRLMGTNHPDYHRVFDAAKARQADDVGVDDGDVSVGVKAAAPGSPATRSCSPASAPRGG